MATVKTFDRANLKTLRADIDQALAAVAKKHGIDLSIGGIRFDANEFTTKITGATKAASAKEAAETAGVPAGVNPTWVKSFKSHCILFGLKPADLGKTIKLAGKEVVIVGARPKANLPVVVQRATGGCVAVSAEAVKLALATA